MNNDIKRTERGWAGHYWNSDKCNFRRNTLLEYNDKKIVVSTIGNYNRPDTIEMQEVDIATHYETKAFIADNSVYNDSDTSQELYFDNKCRININNYDDSVTLDILANNMHEDVVNEMIDRLINDNLSYYISDED